MSRLDNRAYYDDFAGWYERERHLPYHRMLDDLEVEIVERYGRRQAIVLEVGCGTGLILDRVARFATARRAASTSRAACSRRPPRAGSTSRRRSATELPIATASVDVAYSFKVLAHIPDIAGAMREMARVVRPGRLRARRVLQRALAPPARQGAEAADRGLRDTRTTSTSSRATTTPRRSAATCRRELDWVTTRGIRVITPVAARAARPARRRRGALGRASARRCPGRSRPRRIPGRDLPAALNSVYSGVGQILVVDDEQSMREFLAICLRRAGHTVAVAETAPTALEAAHEQPVRRRRHRSQDARRRRRPRPAQGDQDAARRSQAS